MKKRVQFQKAIVTAMALSAAGVGWAQTNSPFVEKSHLQLDSASQTNGLSLQNAIDLASAYNPSLRASGSRVEAAAGRAHQARLWSNPELSFATEDAPVNGGSFRDSKNTIGVAQTVPFPGKKRLDKQIGKAGVRLSEAELALRRLELIRDVKIAFYRVLATEQSVAVSRELVRVAESSSSMARKQVAAGDAGDQVQLRAEIQSEQAKTVLSDSERDLVAARQELCALLGRPDVKNARFIGRLAESPAAEFLPESTDPWLSSHPSVVAARTARDRAELELRRARLDPYPDVTLGVNGGREGREDNSIVEFRVSLPLPIIDRSKGRKQEAMANADMAQAELMVAEQRLTRDWHVAKQRFATAAEQVAAYRDNILPKANKALRLVQKGFDEGKFGIADLVDTQQTAAEARLAYQQKLLELNVAQAELEALTGQSK